jgi:alpha-tubulin suppressor-like RCC1 family protein
MDLNEKRPKLVEDLDEEEIASVSCGAFHTLAVSRSGKLFAFGEGKYGKLGINKKDFKGLQASPE